MRLEPLIFEYSVEDRVGIALPAPDVIETDAGDLLGEESLRSELPLPEVSQVDVIRHYTRLSSMNYGVDTGFYPLGSCTMKYNPKINEQLAAWPAVSLLHPYQDESTVQGLLRILFDMQAFLVEISGMDAVTLQPAAGAHGELTALMIFKRYLERIGEGHRYIVLVPDTSHGTNPATAARCGFQVIKIVSGSDGRVDKRSLASELSSDVAAVMLTNPNTLGLFETDVLEIAHMVHEAGALFYCDGANMNALLGFHRPGDAGFDAMHFNLHKTFSAPHGGGGPGSGPVAVKEFLSPYLPTPIINYRDGRYFLDNDLPDSIGKVHTFYGNVGVILKAYLYVLSLGNEGLRAVSENAVVNANYLLKRILNAYDVPYGGRCMHEFVASAERYAAQGVRTIDIAKRLMDYGFHPPTIYFPLIVREALMIEPTESESIETLDAFADAMLEIAREALSCPEIVKSAPHNTVVSRLDETIAARRPILRWNATGD